MRAPLRPRDLLAVALVSAFALAASGTHVVSSGETLSEIAVANGTSVRSLVERNSISNPNLIVVGQKLTISASSGGGTTTARTYVVERGDTLARIASKFGTTVAALVAANAISNPNVIVTGKTLTISGGGATGGSTGGGAQLSGQRHTVRSGDTIAGIARRYGISQEDFVRWNGLSDGKLYATTRMLLFDPGSLPGSGATGPGTHTVSKGETLSGIATKYGTSSRAIADASSLSSIDTIRIGQKLTIPGSTGGSAR